MTHPDDEVTTGATANILALKLLSKKLRLGSVVAAMQAPDLIDATLAEYESTLAAHGAAQAQPVAPDGFASTTWALVEDYAKAVHDGDDAACVVLSRAIKASLEQAQPVERTPLTDDLEEMTSEQRLRVFGKYCQHCGDLHHVGGLCQCWNDE